ncbi:MAG: hypothetical protein JXC32_13275 [Anaerolineae bacterium]|nr:hypothetical protein [Anaerolineae bacterium]
MPSTVVTPTIPQSPLDTPESPTETPESLIVEWLEGEWRITHYPYALESDPVYAADDKVSVKGLPSGSRYRRGFIYGPRGVTFQGTGLAEDGNYITIDYMNTNIYEDPITEFYFTYGVTGHAV